MPSYFLLCNLCPTAKLRTPRLLQRIDCRVAEPESSRVRLHQYQFLLADEAAPCSVEVDDDCLLGQSGMYQAIVRLSARKRFVRVFAGVLPYQHTYSEVIIPARYCYSITPARTGESSSSISRRTTTSGYFILRRIPRS